MPFKYQKEMKSILNLLGKAEKILCIPHVDPDPDALGSAYAIARMLRMQGKKADVALQNPLVKRYEFYDPTSQYSIYDIPETKESYDLLVILDIGSIKRTGKYYPLTHYLPIINLDHHVDNSEFGDIAIVDANYSATCELVADLLYSVSYEMDTDMAFLLYSGIVFDSGGFRYCNTSPRTHRLVARLLEHPIDTEQVYQRLFGNLSLATLCVRSALVKSMEFLFGGRILISYLYRNAIKHCGANEDDLAGLVNIGFDVNGVHVVVHVVEKKNQNIRVSLRSRGDYPVNKLAHLYAGGGHKNAAGLSFLGSMEEFKKEFIPKLIDWYEAI